jgi:hypothetical protein
LITVKHAYSHFRITLHAFWCEQVAGRARAIQCAACKWVRLGELERYGFPRANQKILAALKAGTRLQRGRRRMNKQGQPT